MNSTSKTIVGWVLLAVGLLVIGQTINLSYLYFGAKADFPAVFKIQATQQATTSNANLQDAQAQVQQSMMQALENVLPGGSVAKLLNMISWSVFATFLVYAGAKICGIGIQLLNSVKNPNQSV